MADDFLFGFLFPLCLKEIVTGHCCFVVAQISILAWSVEVTRARARVYVCVCVRERQTDRQTETERKRVSVIFLRVISQKDVVRFLHVLGTHVCISQGYRQT